MAKKMISATELVDSHRPKNFKYKYLFHDDEILCQLEDEKFDILSLDTIHNDPLVQAALHDTCFTTHERTAVAKAKEPTKIEDGVLISKRMITKADKKLIAVHTGFFDYENNRYMVIKFEYERFDIIEIFMMT